MKTPIKCHASEHDWRYEERSLIEELMETEKELTENTRYKASPGFRSGAFTVYAVLDTHNNDEVLRDTETDSHPLAQAMAAQLNREASG